MTFHHVPLIDRTELEFVKRELGPALDRILGYYRKDGVLSIAEIEDAMASRDPLAMVRPAHTLKGESRQFAANRVAEIAQHLEMAARQSIEAHSELPDGLADEVRHLRPEFHDTIAELERVVADRPVVAPAGRALFGRQASA